MRIYELAKDLGINKKELVAKVRNLGFPVKNHMSVIDPESIARIRAHVERERQASIEQVQVSRAVFRRRRKKRPEGELPPPRPEQRFGDDTLQGEAPPAASPPMGQDKEMDDNDRFKAALEEQLRRHLERSKSAPKTEEGTSFAKKSVTLRTPKKKGPMGPPMVETPLAQLRDEVQAARQQEEQRPPEPVEEPRAPEVEAEPPARPEEPTPPPAKEEPVTAEPESKEPERDQGKDRQRKKAQQQRPPRRQRETRTQSAVVVAIPDQQERDRRLGLTPKRGKKGKTTITKHDLYMRGAGSHKSGWRRSGKKKAVKGGGAKPNITVPGEHKRIIRIEDSITVSELAQRMGIKAGDLLRTLIKLGMMVTINQSLDVDTATLVASEFGYDIKNVAFQEDQVLEQEEDREEDLVPRAPVVTMMGHVDHGKTSLLDKIRQTKVAAGEAGGITQHIGAYNVYLDDTRIVFLDTPGHEAFTSMRARGAQATDIVVLVVAANDGVMPQTIEAINHSKDAGVAIVVAINKIDVPGTNPDRIRQALTEYGLVPEEWGGDTMMVDVSAKTGEGLDELLDAIKLQAEMLELKANPKRKGTGVVLESRLETGRGAVATILVQNGTIKIGDVVVAGIAYGKVRALTDERGKRVKKAGPATPVELIGLNDVPSAGDLFHVVKDEKAARALVEHRLSQHRRNTMPASVAARDLSSLFGNKDLKEVKIIIKADVHGSVEAVREALLKLGTDEVKVSVIHQGVGGVTESDVMLASAAVGRRDDTEVIIVAFNVRAKPKVLDLAANQHVRIKTYTVIYDAIEEIKALMAGMLAPTVKEKYLGRAEVREIFNIPKVGTVAGCMVIDGKIRRASLVRLLRNEVIVWEGKLASLKRFKDDVREVNQGFECGLTLEGYNDIHLGDVVEAYEMEEVAASL